MNCMYIYTYVYTYIQINLDQTKGQKTHATCCRGNLNASTNGQTYDLHFASCLGMPKKMEKTQKKIIFSQIYINTKKMDVFYCSDFCKKNGTSRARAPMRARSSSQSRPRRNEIRRILRDEIRAQNFFEFVD